ncbi:MAG: SCP-2 sterol transfer family protein [Butyrivibrio sp.]|uniref:SCP-2 sterol transfer family protein n=1 Tax=Butyrivibrio sp. TaxID=28121 RepID=UPI0025DE2334|nr:SCP-2 sterol transfer family protein [Butyrivibrio sp.]MCR5770207.1 SCP-2 sterol transfer family protein [Butyrivibrio sp.]
MTYEELVKEVKKNYGALDASGIKEHVAVQFNIEGEAEGAFYVEISDSTVDVEPFEYFDRDAVVTTSADVALKLSSKKISLKDAYDDETAKVWGDLDKILYAYDQLSSKASEPKKAAATKKPAAKKTAAKKPAAKKTTAKKPAAKKTAAKKTAEAAK